MTQKSSHSVLFPVLLLLVSMTSIQSGAALARTLFPEFGVLGVSVLRLVLAAIVLMLVMRPWKSGWPKGSKGRALIVYGISLGGMNLLFYQALAHIPLGIAVALEFTGPLAVAIMGSRRLLDIVWVMLIILGLWLLLPLNHFGKEFSLAGVLYGLGAGACWALYIIWGRKAGARHGSSAVPLGTFVAGIMGLGIGMTQLGTKLFIPHLLPLALAVAILSTALPYSLEMIALRRLPSRLFGTLMSLEPAVATLSGLIFLHQHLSWVQYLAILLIMVAAGGAAKTARVSSEDGVKAGAGQRESTEDEAIEEVYQHPT